MNEYHHRLSALTKKIAKNEFIFITGNSDCFYFSGFNSSNAYILISREKKYNITDARYFNEAKNKIKHLTVSLLKKNLILEIKKLLKTKKIKIFKKDISYNFYENLKKEFGAGRMILSAENIASGRRIKSNDEIKNIKIAAKITGITLHALKKLFISGITELELKNELEYIMRKNGAEALAFDSIVLFGKNTANPHGHSSKTKLKRNDIILIDCGAKYNGYCSDVTRMFTIGKAPEYFKSTYEFMLETQRKAIESLRPEMLISEIEKNILAALKKKKLDNKYLHSTGHGVGIDIHEEPRVSIKTEDRLNCGEVITIEPGIYLPDKFGIRIEDTVVITKTKYLSLTGMIGKSLQ